MFFKDYTSIIISIIWGLGVASLFRKICTNNKCIVVKSKNVKSYYKNNDTNKCYKFYKTNCLNKT